MSGHLPKGQVHGAKKWLPECPGHVDCGDGPAEIKIYMPNGHAKMEINAKNKQWRLAGFRGGQVDFKSTSPLGM